MSSMKALGRGGKSKISKKVRGTRLDKKLAAYSVLAAGVVATSAGQDARAVVVHTPGPFDFSMSSSVLIDFDADGNDEFRVRNAVTSLVLDQGLNPAGLMAVKGGPYGGGDDPAALRFGYLIGTPLSGTGYFGSMIPNEVLADSGGGTRGNFAGANLGMQRFVGVKFDLADGTHFGWIGVRVDDVAGGVTATVTGYAYESDVNTAIVAGDVGQPNNTVPEPATFGLGMLALGAAGVSALKRRRQAEAAA